MREVYVKLHELDTEEKMHAFFSREFSFPEYYGKNYDALFDCLTDVDEDVIFLLDYEGCGEDPLPPGEQELLLVLVDACRNNPALQIGTP